MSHYMICKMENQQTETGIKYIEEHINCENYSTGDKAYFGLYELKTGECLIRSKLKRSALFFVVKGGISVTSAKFVETVDMGHMFFVPVGDIFYSRAESDSTLIRMSFDAELTLCNKYSFSQLAAYADKADHEPRACLLPIAKPLAIELAATEEALRHGLLCIHYQSAKTNIIMNLLRAFYLKEQLAQLFRPMLSLDVGFKNKVLSVCNEAKSIKEMVNMLGMPPSTFNRKFQSAFGIPAGQWLTERKKDGILGDVITSGMNIAHIASKYGFTSNYLAKFCKEHFGMTPTELREKFNRPEEALATQAHASGTAGTTGKHA